MKCDIVRAWKDETYRRTLDSEELQTLPAHPAGEPTEFELAQVVAGSGPDLSSVASSAISTAFAHTERHHHTWAGLCDIYAFSLSVPVIAVPRLIVIGKRETQVCTEAH